MTDLDIMVRLKPDFSELVVLVSLKIFFNCRFHYSLFIEIYLNHEINLVFYLKVHPLM